MTCACCGKDEELRFGICYDCACAGEARAALRTISQHLLAMLRNIWRGSSNAKYDFRWAIGRLTKTGDYAPGGYFERSGIPTNKTS